MADLYFEVQAKYDKVIQLREEIGRLEEKLKSMDSSIDTKTFIQMNNQLSKSKTELSKLADEAAKAGAEVEKSFKDKMKESSKELDSIAEKINAKKRDIHEFSNTLAEMKEKYREASKNGTKISDADEQRMQRMNAILREEKDELFRLTQVQANARTESKQLKDSYNELKDKVSDLKGKTEEAKESTEGLSISWQKAAAILGGAAALKSLVSNIMAVRQEFQSADVAIQTLLGSKQKADELMAKVRDYAKISPLEFSDVTAATKMMLGFNIEAEKVPKFLAAIGDVAMGNKQQFNSLTLAFSQMSATGKLMGQDLLQMINAGFNPLTVMAEKTGKSVSKLKEEMSKGAISAEMVQQAFIDATSEGGKFYKMSENASKTLEGQISMLQDALASCYNEIGKSTEGLMMGAIQMTTKLIENYEVIGKVLVGLVGTYGAYRTAVILCTAAENSWTVAEQLHYKWLVLAEKAQKLLNATMLKNPYVLAATALGVLVTTICALSRSESAAETALNRYNKEAEENKKIENARKKKIDDALVTLQDASNAELDRAEALRILKQEYPSIFEKYDIEKNKLSDIVDLKQKIADYDKNRGEQKVEDSYKNLQDVITRQRSSIKRLEDLGTNEALVQARQLKEKLKVNEELLNLYQKDYQNVLVSKYKQKLSGYSQQRLESELGIVNADYTKRNGINLNGVTVKSDSIRSDMAKYIQSLIEIKKSEESLQTTYTRTKKAYEDAKKALDNIDKNKDRYTQKERDDAKRALAEAKKAYTDAGGDPEGKQTKKEETEAKKRQQALEKQQKAEENAGEILLGIMQENAKGEQRLMDDSAEKASKKIENDYNKRINTVLKKANELSNANRTAKNADANQTMYVGGVQVSNLTAEQVSVLKKTIRLAEQEMDKQREDERKKEQADRDAYLKEYGTYEEQRLAITQEYEAKIAEAKNEWERNSMRNAMEKELNELEKDYSATFKKIFADVNKQTTSSLSTALDLAEKELESMAKSGNFNASDYKALADQASKLRKALSESNLKGYRTDMNSLVSQLLELRTLQKDIDLQTSNNNQLLQSLPKQIEQLKEYKEWVDDNNGDTAVSEDLDRQIDKMEQQLEDAKNFSTEAAEEESRVMKQNLMKSAAIAGAQAFASALGEAADYMQKVADLTGDTQLADYSEQMSAFSENLQAAGNGASSGGWVGAIVGGLSNIASQITSGIQETKLWVLQFAEELEDFQFKIKLLSLSINDDDYDSVFGVNSMGKATDAYKKMQEAAEEYNEYVTRQMTEDDVNTSKKYKNLGAAIYGGWIWGFDKTNTNLMKQQQDALDRQLTVLQGMSIRTKKYSGWAKLFGKQDKYESLYDIAPELWDENGDFNVDAAEAFLETCTLITDEQKEEIQNAIDLKNAYDEALQTVKDDISDTFDSLASSLTDTLWDSVINGASAWDDFEDIGKSVIENLGQSMIQSLIIDKYLNQFEQELIDAYGIEDDSERTKKLISIYNKIQETYPDMMDETSTLISDIEQLANNIGVTLADDYTQTASTTVSESMTEDTAAELVGRATAIEVIEEDIKGIVSRMAEENTGELIKASTEDLKSAMEDNTSVASSCLDLMATTYLEIASIRENTDNMVKPIKSMSENIQTIKEKVSTL